MRYLSPSISVSKGSSLKAPSVEMIRELNLSILSPMPFSITMLYSSFKALLEFASVAFMILSISALNSFIVVFTLSLSLSLSFTNFTSPLLSTLKI